MNLTTLTTTTVITCANNTERQAIINRLEHYNIVGALSTYELAPNVVIYPSEEAYQTITRYGAGILNCKRMEGRGFIGE